MQSRSRTPGRVVTLARGAGDVPGAGNELERGAPFCANPACALHVRLADAHVEGGGNWVRLPDGRVFGRGRYGGALLCDACGTRRGPVRLDSQWYSKRWRSRQYSMQSAPPAMPPRCAKCATPASVPVTPKNSSSNP